MVQNLQMPFAALALVTAIHLFPSPVSHETSSLLLSSPPSALNSSIFACFMLGPSGAMYHLPTFTIITFTM